jgi:tRNA dimethylallyltransferase
MVMDVPERAGLSSGGQAAGAARRAALIAGPTASGKSALALRLAAETGAIIVNADALQVYDGLSILTARPSAADLTQALHRLYGFVDPATRFSTGAWLRAASEVVAGAGDTPLIFVGGTGLYFSALTEGFADVPEVPQQSVAYAEAQIAGLDRDARGRLIAERDPRIAARLKAPDPQRVARALAVLHATGRSLAAFQDELQPAPLAGFALERIVLNPERDLLRERIAQRFRQMWQGDAIEEVEALLARDLDPALPALKAIGVPEITAMLAGEIDADEAMARAITATHQYAKRQRTWFRGRMQDWEWRSAP